MIWGNCKKSVISTKIVGKGAGISRDKERGLPYSRQGFPLTQHKTGVTTSHGGKYGTLRGISEPFLSLSGLAVFGG